MKTIHAYISGLKLSAKSVKMVLFIYLINIALGLIVLLPFHSTLQSAFGSSMLPDVIVKGFDFTAFSEFMRQSFKNISGFIGQMKWVVLFYMILNILFAGGILSIIKGSDKFKVQNFINGGVHYFFRFLKLSLYMLIFYLAAALIVFLPISLIIKSAAETVESEASLFYIGLIGTKIFAAIMIILIMVSFYTKIRIVNEDSRKVFRSIFKSFGFVFRHFLSTFFLAIMLIINLAVLFLIFWFLNKIIGTSTGITILIMFIFQQLFIFTRVFFRVWAYASQFNLFVQR